MKELCKHPGCNKIAYKPLHEPGLHAQGCREHMNIIVEYLKKKQNEQKE